MSVAAHTGFGRQRILYHISHGKNLYAARFLAEGYRDAFRDLGHEFEFVSIRDSVSEKLEDFRPDLYLTSIYLLPWIRRRGGLAKLSEHKRRGMVVGSFTTPWEISGLWLHSLRRRPDVVSLARRNIFPDFFHSPHSERFLRRIRAETGRPCIFLPEAANKLIHFNEDTDPRFECDAVYLGHYIRHKRSTFREYLDPLRDRFDVRVLGRDWSLFDRSLGLIQSASQLLGLRVFDQLRRLPNTINEERLIYSSAKISLNMHSSHQRDQGLNCNARTFIIPACGGFQICDDLGQIREFFSDREVVVARDRRDWIEAVGYFLAHPAERAEMAVRAAVTVQAKHTYHQRALKLLDTARCIREGRAMGSDS